MREIVFDTETTGLSPQEGHRIIEIGCVELVNRMPTGRTYHQYINPEREIDAGAMRVHGITNEKVAGMPTFDQVYEEMLAFFGDAALVAHNASFDMNFINTELGLVGCDPLANEVVDTLALARQQYPGSQHTLDALCRRFDIDLSVRTYHGALLDADLLAKVYLEMSGGRQGDLSLADTTGTTGVDDTRYGKTIARAARAFPPSAGELAAHRAFVGTIGDNLWPAIADE